MGKGSFDLSKTIGAGREFAKQPERGLASYG